jgi:DNA-directed RNA polymerase specialized sigma24 family protein
MAAGIVATVNRDEQIRAARGGDPAARTALVKWLSTELWQFLAKRHAEQEIADLVQEALADILVKLPTHAPDTTGRFLRWAIGFASIEARKRATEDARERAARAKLAAQMWVLASRVTSKLRKWHLARHYVRRLPRIYRNTLLLRLDGRDYESIARREGVAEATVRRRVSVGLEKLRALIMRDEAHESTASPASNCG